jgi:hypothetical protein
MRPTVVLLTAMLAVMACGAEAPAASGPVHSSPPAAPTNGPLYLGDGSALTVFDAATGEVGGRYLLAPHRRTGAASIRSPAATPTSSSDSSTRRPARSTASSRSPTG